MHELPPNPEEQSPAEYSIENHKSFVDSRLNAALKKAEAILGFGIFTAGMIATLVGIGDFASGGEVSKTLLQVQPSIAPELITWFSQHLAQMPQYIKLSGGPNLIIGGLLLLEHSNKK